MKDGPSPETNAQLFAERAPADRLKRKLPGAVSLSVAAHICSAILVGLILGRTPDLAVVSSTHLPQPDAPVWLVEPGPGGNRGGGAANVDPPQRLRREGPAHITQPAASARTFEPHTTVVEREPELQMGIPAVPLAADPSTAAGILQTVSVVDAGSRSGSGSGSGPGEGSAAGSGSGAGPVGLGGGPGGGSGITGPQVLKQVRPKYTNDAMRARVQGVVLLDAVVLPDGSVGDVHIVRSVDAVFGLDLEAIKAVKQWRFAPATRRGQPIPVTVAIELTFTLR